AAAGGVRFLFIGRAIGDVDTAAVRLPARNARCKGLIGVRDAPVVLFLEFVFHRVRRGVAAQPELLDELLAFLVRLQALEGGALFVADDVRYVFVQPFAVRRFELLAQLLLLAAALFLGHRPRDGLSRGRLRLLFILLLRRGENADREKCG